MNLLNRRLIRSIFESPLYPKFLQLASVAVFVAIMIAALFGPTNRAQNFGLAITWILWWPLIPLAFFLAGRLWCAICPFAWLSDLIQKYFGADRPVPQFLRAYGLWIIDVFFIAITWSDHVFGIVESPRGSGYLLLLITGMVILTGAFFQRRTFCRYICFIGGLSGNYSRSGILQLRATPETCKTCTTQSCFKGDGKTPGCPMFEFPRTMEDSTKCNLCGNCVKTCPNDSITLRFQTPTKELWSIRRPRKEEVFLAAIIMGIVLIQNVTMLSIWEPMLDGIKSFLHTDSFTIAFSVLFAFFMGLPVALLWGVSSISGMLGREKAMANFTTFGYAIIPLDLAAHMAHNLFHLLTEGKAVGYITLSLFGRYVSGGTGFAPTSTVFHLQIAILALGTLGSLFVAYRIAKNRFPGRPWRPFMPHALFFLGVLLLNIYTFSLPMMHRI